MKKMLCLFKRINAILVMCVFFTNVSFANTKIFVDTSISDQNYEDYIITYGSGAVFEIKYDATLTISNSNFKNNKAQNDEEYSYPYAGAIGGESGRVKINDNVNFIQNYSKYEGGAIAVDRLEISGSNILFSSNTSNYYGGAISLIKENYASINGNNIRFENNKATNLGGAIQLGWHSACQIGDGIVFLQNKVTNGDGGAIANTGSSYMEIGNNVIFSSNSATTNGGAVYNDGVLNISNNGYYYNNTAQVGGALLNFDSGIMNVGYDSYFEKNRTTNGEGGAIENCGTLIISSGTNFVLNTATTNGGAISNAMYINGDFVANANVTDNVTFSSNSAKYGGAFSNISAKATIGKNNIFEYNTSTNEGGAIYNTKNDYKDVVGQITISSNTKFLNNTALGLGGAIFNNSGIITIGSTATFNNNSAYNGGAIASLYEGSNIQIGDNVTFSSNMATNNGGAIYNETGTVNIGKNSKFDLNKTTVTVNGANGGAIANFGTMVIDENAIFDSNETGVSGSGGAIHNCKNHDGTIAYLTIKDGTDFINNIATSGGGAISNYNEGRIYILDNVSFTSNTANRFGGAILNYSSDNTINAGTVNIGNNAKFINNTAQTDCGGAITNAGNITIGDNALFEQNSSAGNGGAIYNSKRGNITIGENVTFSNNTEQYNGGAIHNEGILTLLDGGTFINNSANGTGGAIYLYNDNITEIPNSRTVNLIAKTNNIEFTGNTANGISNAIHSNGGIIKLWASNSASIIFNDAITSYDGAGKTNVLNINSSTTTLTATGKVILNEDMSGYGGQVNLYNGEIELQAKTSEGSNVNANKFFSGNINLNKGTLNILNNAIDNISVNNLTTTSNTNLKIDTDLSNNTSDNFTITNNVTGQLNLTAINILGVDGTSGQITLFNNGNAPELNILTTSTYGEYEYNFTNGTSGKLNYTRGEQTNLKKTVNKTEPAIRSYSLSENETVTENLGYLGGTQLTIFGNGHDIEANNNVYGIGVEEGQILEIEGVNNITGFYNSSNWGGAIMNHGTTNIGNDIKFSSNSCFYGGGAIHNMKMLNIGSNVIFSSNTSNNSGGAINNSGDYGGRTLIGANVLFEYNKSNTEGGAIINTDDGNVNIGDNANFVSNTATDYAGAIWNQNIMIIGNNAKYVSNEANNWGGAIVNCKGTLTLEENNLFTLNNADKGGAINNLAVKGYSGDGIINIGNNVNFTSNTATNGGAIYNFGEKIITVKGQQVTTKVGTININDNGSFSYNTATENGGAIYNGGNMNIGSNSKFEYNKTNVYGGGAIFNEGQLDIGTNVTFSSNTTTDGGGAIDNENGGIITLGANALFEYNKSDVIGGAIRNTGDGDSSVSIENNSIFVSNDAGGAGGAIWNSKEMEIKEGVTFYSNTANQFGGAIVNCIGTLTLKDNNTFNLNNSQKGGAIANLGLKNENEKGILNIGKNVDFSSNTATNGGVIYNFGEETITLYGQQFNTDKGTINISSNSTFSYNTATENGGAIYNAGNMNIGSNSKFEHNKSDVIGGAIYNDYAILTIENGVTFSSNTAAFGGAIFNDNNSKITVGNYAIFNSNMAISYGGVIYNDSYSEMTINNNVTFSFNKANDDGGAIYNDTYSTMIIGNNATFNFNTADEGGAIYNYDYATLTIGDGVTFSSNTAVHGGAIYNENSLIAIGDNSQFISNISKKDDSYLFDEAVGGAIYNFNGSTVTIGNGTNFTSNSADEGGAIYNDGDLVIGKNALFSLNSSDGYGGGAICNEGYIEIGTNVSFSSNIANTGGAIANYDSSIINIGKDAQFNFNISSVSGGAIYNFNSSKILIGKNAIFNSNKAKNGGAINLYYNSTVTIDELAKFSKNIANHKGGAIQNDADSTLIVLDGAIFEYNVAQSSGGAIYNGDNSFCNLIAKTNNIEFTGNTANGISNAIHDDCGTINLWASDSASVIFNDRITSENSSSVLNINKSSGTLPTTGKIILNENMGGYTGQVNFYNGTIKLGEKGTLFGGNMFVDNATIDMANEIIQEHNFNTLTINNTLNLVVDADLQNKQMDTISADSFTGTGKIKVNAINILSDNNEKETTKILFTSSTVLKDKIETVNTVSSKLYKYDVIYNNGYFNFTNTGGNKPEINPILLEASIANSIGGFVTQTTIFNQAFASMENIRSRILRVKNNISNESPLYASTANTIFFQKTNRIESGLWLRPFYSQETINLDNLSVDNTLIGTLAGVDLATGENSLVSLYLGYAGSEQKYENIKVSQTGYILGVTGMLVKEQWYAGLTANINFNKAESQSSYGTDNFDMNMYSVGAKAGYNFDLSDKWMLEPNLTLMYGNVNSQEYQTKQGAKVEGQSIANIIFEPQIKAKLNLENGWQPYGLIGYVVNAGDKVTTKVEEVEFDGQKIGNYVEFGAGVDKSFKNSPWSLYIQLTGRSGDRTGFDGNFGIKYSFLTAKEKRKIAKIKKIQERRKAKQKYLKQRRKREIEE